MEAIPAPNELVLLFEKGTLLGEMARRFGLRDQAKVQMVEERCAALHNMGTIDLLGIIEGDALRALGGARFFMAMHLFCRILPELEATPARMMASVEALVSHGGEDMAANEPNAAFRKWCARVPERARDVIVAAQHGNELASRHLTFALEAISEITDARSIALTYEDARCISAITALGRLDGADPRSYAETFAVFNTILDRRGDDSLRANMLHATVAIIARGHDALSPEAIALVRRLNECAEKLTLNQSAHVLWAYREAMQPAIVTILLDALLHLDPANKGTVKELDLGLQVLLELGHDEAAINFVTQMLSRTDDDLELEELGSFTSTLISGPSERVGRVTIQWLLLGAPRLCGGIASALQGRGLDGPPLNLRAEDLAISSTEQVFICRKAIGWFFLKPTTAASVLVSVLRVCDSETALVVQQLLVDPLLLNYSGVRAYLEELTSEDVAKDRINQALARNEVYLEALQAVPLIAELQPSEHNRRIERLRMSVQMSGAHKQARSQSVLLSMVKHSVLLYGNRSLSFVKDGNNSRRPMEMDLKPYGISFEMPRMEIIDPVGLDHILRTFRYERMVK